MASVSIVILNPNSTERMTQDMAAVATKTLASLSPSSSSSSSASSPPFFKLIASRTNIGAPPAIQGEADALAAVAGLLKMVDEYLVVGSDQDMGIEQPPPQVDSFIIGCADDVGLSEIQQLIQRRFTEDPSASFRLVQKKRPTVLGITQAATLAVMALLPPPLPYSIVTTVSDACPVLSENIKRYGTHTRCASVRAAEVLVLDLEARPDESLEKLCKTIEIAVCQDGAAAIVLGCAGMSGLRASMQQRFPRVLFVDGVSAAVRLAVSMAGLC